MIPGGWNPNACTDLINRTHSAFTTTRVLESQKRTQTVLNHYEELIFN